MGEWNAAFCMCLVYNEKEQPGMKHHAREECGSFIRGGSPLSSGQYLLVLRRRYRCRTKQTTHTRTRSPFRTCMPEISRYNLLLLPATSRWNIHASHLTFIPFFPLLLRLRTPRLVCINQWYRSLWLKPESIFFSFPRKKSHTLFRNDMCIAKRITYSL